MRQTQQKTAGRHTNAQPLYVNCQLLTGFHNYIQVVPLRSAYYKASHFSYKAYGDGEAFHIYNNDGMEGMVVMVGVLVLRPAMGDAAAMEGVAEVGDAVAMEEPWLALVVEVIANVKRSTQN